MVAASTAGGSASLRMQVWRKLRSLGAVYVQQSVCLLPARDQVLRELRRLVARVRAEGGTARMLTVDLPEQAEYDDLVAEFNAARDVEYAEVVERTPAFLAEIEMETKRGRATYAEVEESEADLDRFKTWLGKITARDYFGAPGGEPARAAVAECEQALAAFEQAALSAEALPTGEAASAQAAGAGRLRLVAGNPPGTGVTAGRARKPRGDRQGGPA
ncbi:Chromate resistance protein ChrB [Micromonospora sp. SL1-18]|uniref:Chromate resistance protein ChrB n=1 Tax=Micromonospora sp. SL1-18 TaxID=3399128 RepID=UPI003A4D6871